MSDLTLLGTQVRALYRQMAILQAGLGEIDKQFTDLGNAIAGKVTAAIDDHLSAIEGRLAAIEADMP
jgi:hypothetical protein